MPIRVLLVDDEALARDTLRLLLQDRPAFEIVGECRNGREAVDAIAEEKPDIVFLDIQMPGLTGFEVVEAIGAANMPVTVFATAYDQYALKAFEAQALDYLLKPFDDERFEKVLDRARERVLQRRLGAITSEYMAFVGSDREAARSSESAQSISPGPASDPDRGTSPPPAVATTPDAWVDRFMVKDRDSIQFVRVEEIDRVESAGDYVTIHCGKKTHLLRETMSGMESKLDGRKFARIHRSTIVQIDRIRELKPFFHGDYIVYLHDGTELKLSRRYWGRLERLMAPGP